MTVSHRNRIQDQRPAGNTFVARTRRSFGVASLCVAASLASVGGFAVNDVAAHHDESCFPVNQNTRSIQMIESKEAPVTLAVSQNTRSILMIESKEAPVATADNDTLPSFVVDQNRRSILLIEGLQTPNAVVDDESLPTFAMDQNRRSIQLIEGKEAPVEVAEDD